jgi:hypothetical protein
MPGLESLSDSDRERLAAAGIPLAEAGRQLALLASPPQPVRLLRPARLGDGVETIARDRETGLLALAGAARDAGRFTKFVPASGAATRMFRALHRAVDRFGDERTAAKAAAAGDHDADEAMRTLTALETTAVGREMARLAAGETLFSWLATAEGRRFASLPKALLPFHLLDGRARTAFAEQLAEGREYVADAAGRARLHFTIPDGERARFAGALAQESAERGFEGADVDFSEQLASTHALALDERGEPARAADGSHELLLRPSGHGALLANLARVGEAGGDIVFVKNIDNVLPADRHAAIARWKLLLAGHLLEVERSRRDRSRPLRVCGVVGARGEPGGGPFWVRRVDGVESLQIVESAQVDLDDPEQRAIWSAATHFNPVDLVLSLRVAPGGAPWELDRFVDETTAFVAEKSEGGRALTVYERPGLWNGAMAGWETRLVEVPPWTFAPVKTLLDLARPEHRVRGS